MKKINLIEKVKQHKLLSTLMLSTLMLMTSATAFASESYEGKSMLNSDITTLIVNTGADLVQTVLGLVVILLPVGLTLWGIGFGVKKGINFLKKNANKSIG